LLLLLLLLQVKLRWLKQLAQALQLKHQQQQHCLLLLASLLLLLQGLQNRTGY
jgi:hypothetical protein